jgi:glycine C-acetyltransferase
MPIALERRRCLRAPLSGLQIFSRNTGKLVGKSRDISPTGMFIETENPPNPGTKILLEFKLPSEAIPIKTYSEVRWNKKGLTSQAPGMGVQFINIYESDTNRLARYTKSLIVGSSPEEEKINSDDFTLADFINIPDKDLFAKTEPFWEYVEDVKRKGYYIYRKLLLSSSQNRAKIFDEITGKEREIIIMGSSNYLGLNTHPKVIEAGKKALKKYGTGPVGSPMHTGSFDIHRALENKLAEMKGCEDAMTFSSGYTANIGCISGLVRKGDLAIIDRLSHASVVDGCVFSGSPFRTFRHSDMQSLRQVLEDSKGKYNGKLIIVDGVYSTEGDIPPLPDITEVAKEYGARVMVDDAHATGVVGEGGMGTVHHFNMEGKVDIVMGTLSKALGGVGGFITSSKEVINYLRHYARSAFFSATIPPAIAASVLAAIEVMESEPERHQTLWRNINYMKENLKALGFNILNPQSALIFIIIGDDLLAKKMSKRIFEEGVYLSVFPYPSVPIGQERFRLSMSATHTIEDLDRALEIFEKVGKEFGVLDPARPRAVFSTLAA